MEESDFATFLNSDFKTNGNIFETLELWAGDFEYWDDASVSHLIQSHITENGDYMAMEKLYMEYNLNMEFYISLMECMQKRYSLLTKPLFDIAKGCDLFSMINSVCDDNPGWSLRNRRCYIEAVYDLFRIHIGTKRSSNLVLAKFLPNLMNHSFDFVWRNVNLIDTSFTRQLFSIYGWQVERLLPEQFESIQFLMEMYTPQDFEFTPQSKRMVEECIRGIISCLCSARINCKDGICLLIKLRQKLLGLDFFPIQGALDRYLNNLLDKNSTPVFVELLREESIISRTIPRSKRYLYKDGDFRVFMLVFATCEFRSNDKVVLGAINRSRLKLLNTLNVIIENCKRLPKEITMSIITFALPSHIRSICVRDWSLASETPDTVIMRYIEKSLSRKRVRKRRKICNYFYICSKSMGPTSSKLTGS